MDESKENILVADEGDCDASNDIVMNMRINCSTTSIIEVKSNKDSPNNVVDSDTYGMISLHNDHGESSKEADKYKEHEPQNCWPSFHHVPVENEFLHNALVSMGEIESKIVCACPDEPIIIEHLSLSVNLTSGARFFVAILVEVITSSETNHAREKEHQGRRDESCLIKASWTHVSVKNWVLPYIF